MAKRILSLLTGQKVLEEINSPVNGHIIVIKDFAWGTHIQVNGITQAGGVVGTIWKTLFKKLQKKSIDPKSCLILGLGGGTIANLTRTFYPSCQITGIDLDPVMVELGKKYLGLENSKTKIVIKDAITFVNQILKSKTNKFDLVLVDVYVGDEFPKKFDNEKFIKSISLLLTNKGIAVFNRLYYGEKRSQAVKFGAKLEKVFKKVEYFYPEANLMFVCMNH